MKIRYTWREIVIIIRLYIRQYSYCGFMQIRSANYLAYKHYEDTILSAIYVHVKFNMCASA